MAIIPSKTQKARGFTLLVAVIFMSVLLALGLALSSAGYKQVLLASIATQSTYAFYAADAALECALYDDTEDVDNPGYNTQGEELPFAYDSTTNNPAFACGNNFNLNSNNFSATPHICKDLAACPDMKVTYFRIPISYANPVTLQPGEETRCADVTVYDQDPDVFTPRHTWIFAQGYDVSCATLNDSIAHPEKQIRITARGLQADLVK